MSRSFVCWPVLWIALALSLAGCAAPAPRSQSLGDVSAMPPASPAEPVAAVDDQPSSTAHVGHQHDADPAEAAQAPSSSSAAPPESTPVSGREPAPAPQPVPPTGRPEPRPEALAEAAPSASTPRVASRPAQADPPDARAEASTPRVLRGTLRLLPARGQRVEADDFREAVVWFVPDGGGPVRPGRYTMNTLQKGFDPSVLAVSVGSTVRFPNGDPVLHNVYSESAGNAFDLGLYGPGEAPTHRFDRAGVVDVHCNVHRRMQAKILVVESHHIGRIAADGRFEIGDVPAGAAGRLVAWHPRGDRVERRLAADAVDGLVIELPLVRPRAEAFDRGARR
jgi:hypothetical protein